MIVIRHPAVIDELIDLAYYIALEDPETADRFLIACEEAFGQLARMPYLGSQRAFNKAQLQDMRMWRVKGFDKHLIFYRPIQNGIEVLHIIHSARDYGILFDED